SDAQGLNLLQVYVKVNFVTTVGELVWSMMEAQQLLELEVRELIRSQGIDPTGQPDTVRELVASATASYDQRSMHAPLPMVHDMAATQQAIFDAVAGFGQLQPLLDDPE